MWRSKHGRIVVSLDEEASEYHVTCGGGYRSADLSRVLQGVRDTEGLVPLDAEEEPELILPDGSVRIWLRKACDATRTLAYGAVASLGVYATHGAEVMAQYLGLAPLHP